MAGVSTGTTGNAWKERERVATLLLAVAAKRQAIMDRLLRYRADNARPQDRKGLLPQEEAADRAGVRARQWQRWENGETVPHPSNLQQIAEKLGIPVEEFFDREAMQKGVTPDLMSNGTDPNRKLDEILEGQRDLAKRLLIIEQALLKGASTRAGKPSSPPRSRRNKGRQKPPSDAQEQ